MGRDERRMNEYEDWIIRFYASHSIISKGHKDGEIIENLIRCKDCKYYTGYECIRNKIPNIRVITKENDYCSSAERKEE